MKQGRPGQAVYRLVSWCLSPLVFSHLLWRSLHDGGYLYWRQRRGLSLPQIGEVIWIHAASVGEINTAAALIKALQQRYPESRLLITTNTPTGRAAIASQGLDGSASAYLPLDYAFAIRRFLRANQVRCAIIIETEIWPMLLEHCHFPLAIVNGRLSQRTLRVTRSSGLSAVAAAVYRRAVSHIDLVLARSDEDATRFTRLGVPQGRIQSLGNLKFATLQQATAERRSEQATAPFTRRYCLLASTHHDEELQLTRQWLQHRRSELLVIAPRHPDRSSTLIRQLLELTDALAVRSRGDVVDSTTVVYLADTLGEMPLWYRHAAAVFIGGSLIPRGGHNMLEPARLAQSVVIGPYSSNFHDEVALFLSREAIVQAGDTSEAVRALIELLDSPATAAERGQRALRLLGEHQHVLQRYLSALSPLLTAR